MCMEWGLESIQMGTGLTVVLHREAAEGSFVVVTCLRAQILVDPFFSLVLQSIMV